MIDDLVTNGIKNISDGKKIDLLELLSISLYLGGENIFKNNSRELYIKLNNSLEYSSYRNVRTILSNDNSGFLIGEIFPFEIRKQYKSEILKSGYAMINIEMICVPPTVSIDGESPLEILLNLNDLMIREIVKNSMYLDIVSKKITAFNKNDLLLKLTEKVRIDSTDIVFLIDDDASLFLNKDGEVDIWKIKDLSKDFGEISQVNDLTYIDEIIGV